MSVITVYAIEQLASRVDGLALGEGLQVTALADGWVRGDVSISERKGKHFAVYALELELPWSGCGCSGLLVLPDVCLELLADVEVEVQSTEGTLPAEAAEQLQTAGAAAVRAAVQEWGYALAKTVREDSTRATVPVDPPSEAQAPRAAFISEEEAGCNYSRNNYRHNSYSHNNYRRNSYSRNSYSQPQHGRCAWPASPCTRCCRPNKTPILHPWLQSCVASGDECPLFSTP